MSIGINAANLATEGLELELPGGVGGRIYILLGQSGGLTGRYEQDAGRIALREIAAHQLSVQELELPLAHGTLRVDSPSILSGLHIDAELGREHPFAGRVTMASAGAQIAFERGPIVVRAGLSLAGASYERSGLTGHSAEIASLDVGTLRLELAGGARVHVERLSLRGVRCTIEPGGELSLRCGAARAESIVVEHGGHSIQTHRVAFSSGFELLRGRLSWPELTLERLELASPELPRPRAAAGAPRSPRAERAVPELPLLDHLQGLLAFDLLLDLRIPILPDRRATHSIRLPITEGAIDFKQLEGCLAGLEDALLDFEVNEEGLILELDPIPGVTFDNVTLVTWPLAGHEHVVARAQQKIRLRRLLEYRLNPKLASSGGERAGSERPPGLRRLHIGDIETVLRLGGPVVQPWPGLGTLRLGAPDQPAAGELKLSGQLELSPGATPAATELRLDARDVLLGASIADERGRRAEVERLTIGRVEAARLGLLGLQPRSLGLRAAGLRLAGVELHGWLARAPRA